MATIYREFEVAAPAGFVWEALRDVGAVHQRLARGFVVDTVLLDDLRTVTFANGAVVHERIVAIDDSHRRIVYSVVDSQPAHHNAYFQVFEVSPQVARLVWVTDLLPEEARGPLEQMVDQGVRAIQRTFEQATT